MDSKPLNVYYLSANGWLRLVQATGLASVFRPELTEGLDFLNSPLDLPAVLVIAPSAEYPAFLTSVRNWAEDELTALEIAKETDGT